MKIIILLSLLTLNVHATQLLCRGPLSTSYLQQFTGESSKVAVFKIGLEYSNKMAGDKGVHLPSGYCGYRTRPVSDDINTKTITLNLDGNYWSRDVISSIVQCTNTPECVMELSTQITSSGTYSVNTNNSINNVSFHRPLKFKPLLTPVTTIPIVVTPK